MAWQIEFDQQHQLICLTFLGKVSSQEVRESTIAAIAMMHDQNTRQILTDFTDVTSLGISSVEIVLLPESYEALGMQTSFKEAVVAPKSSPIRKDTEFYETVCTNRGKTVRVFENRAQAFDWLRQKS